jgi:hypothetical protein
MVNRIHQLNWLERIEGHLGKMDITENLFLILAHLDNPK